MTKRRLQQRFGCLNAAEAITTCGALPWAGTLTIIVDGCRVGSVRITGTTNPGEASRSLIEAARTYNERRAQ